MARKLKIKLPKRVAGVKIPKSVRKGPIGQLLNSGMGQVLLAEAVVAASAMFAATKLDDDSATGAAVERGKRRARRFRHVLTDTGSDQSERLMHALREAGRAFRAALHDDGVVWQEEPEVHEGDVKVKKKSSGRAYSSVPH